MILLYLLHYSVCRVILLGNKLLKFVILLFVPAKIEKTEIIVRSSRTAERSGDDTG